MKRSEIKAIQEKEQMLYDSIYLEMIEMLPEFKENGGFEEEDRLNHLTSVSEKRFAWYSVYELCVELNVPAITSEFASEAIDTIYRYFYK